MTVMDIKSFAAGQWIAPNDAARAIYSAIDGTQIARAGNSALDTDSMLDYARNVGGPALRHMTFHERWEWHDARVRVERAARDAE